MSLNADSKPDVNKEDAVESPVLVKNANIDINEDSGRYNLVPHKIPTMKFLRFYRVKKLWLRFLIMVIIGAIASFELILFVKSPGNYSSGISALTQGISSLILTALEHNEVNKETAWIIYNSLYWSLYFIVNIPLFILGFKTIGKNFTLLTITYIATSMIVGFIISVSAKDGRIQNILLLGNTIPMGDAYGSTDVQKSTNIFTMQGVNAVPFWYPTTNPNIFDMNEDPTKAILLFLYGFAHGVFAAIFCSIVYIVGASTGGTDFISFWYANKGKNLGKILLIISICTTFLGGVIGTWIPACIADPIAKDYRFLFSANLLASFFSAFICITFLKFLYPTGKIVKLEIFTKNESKVVGRLIELNYAHSATLHQSADMRYKKEAGTLVTYCLFSEIPRIIDEVKLADNDAFIAASPVTGVQGLFNVWRQGDPVKPKPDKTTSQK